MKFKEEHYKALKESVKELLASINKTIPQIRENYENTGKAETRLLWDVYWASRWAQKYSAQSYQYSDSHIETAIKKIVKELE